MIGLLCFALAVLASPFKSKVRLEAENAALRHQLIVLKPNGSRLRLPAFPHCPKTDVNGTDVSVLYVRAPRIHARFVLNPNICVRMSDGPEFDYRPRCRISFSVRYDDVGYCKLPGSALH
jgi:hypothetical protein